MTYFLLIVLLGLLCQTQYYRILPSDDLSEERIKTLENLGKKALLHDDVPIAALLLYEDSLIGYGYNTVRKNQELSGHAEVNAINMAYRNFGLQFHKLNREHMIMYSTFEPCEMCKGMMLHYDIEEVRFERKKKLSKQLKSTINTWLYEFSKRQFDADSLQEKLFLKHPDYKIGA